jgi:hypothetical protein
LAVRPVLAWPPRLQFATAALMDRLLAVMKAFLPVLEKAFRWPFDWSLLAI